MIPPGLSTFSIVTASAGLDPSSASGTAISRRAMKRVIGRSRGRPGREHARDGDIVMDDETRGGDHLIEGHRADALRPVLDVVEAAAGRERRTDDARRTREAVAREG